MAQATDAPARGKLVCFFVGEQEFALEISQVRESLIMRPLTPVFLTPQWLAGVINVRGEIVAVLDTGTLLGEAPISVGPKSRIVIIKSDKGCAGLLVDSLAELRALGVDDIQPVPATVSAHRAALLRGVVPVESGAVRIIDASAIFQSESLRQFRRNQ
jgi:purine-binding chemotaxis protein CheW